MNNWLIKNKSKLIIAAVVVAVLVGAFLWGGNYPKSNSANDAVAAQTETSPSAADTSAATTSPTTSPVTEKPEASTEPSALPSPSPDTAATTDSSANTSSTSTESATSKPAPEGSSEGVYSGDEDYSGSNGMVIDPDTGKDQYLTDPVPEGKPLPVEPQNAVVTVTQLTCTLSVRCDTILNNMDLLDNEKHELVPEDGVIFPATVVTFYEGESVFNVLQREMKKAGIQMEFENTPIYNSAYIEGINNLYEFDTGELSGWVYKVNDWFPNYGCSRYQLKDGDVVEWVYTCDLGKDVGGYYSVGS